MNQEKFKYIYIVRYIYIKKYVCIDRYIKNMYVLNYKIVNIASKISMVSKYLSEVS